MSIDLIHRALYALWSHVKEGVAAYPANRVPDNAVMPYLTFTVSSGAPMSRDALVLIDWHTTTHDGTAAAERAELMALIAAEIPVGGRTIPLPGGLLRLERNDDGFQQYYDDPANTDVIGGRTSIIVEFLTT